MTEKIPVQISPSEWEIMRVLWDAKRPLNAAEIVRALDGVSDWKPKTIRTYINRLVAKNAVSAEMRIAAGYELLHFEPLLGEREIVRAERRNFLSRFFGGTVESMLASCIESGDISEEELEQIRKLVNQPLPKP